MRRVTGLALVGVTLLGGAAWAQGAQGDQPAVAMGNGRMVQGTITAVAPDHLSVKTVAGDVYTVVVTPNTQVRKERNQIKYADVHVGDGVGAMGEIDRPNKTVHALYLGVIDAEQLKKAREAMGKSYISGRVTAIDEVKLTILRTDGVTQVIQVDEDTSFKRGGRGMQMLLGGGEGGFGAGGQGRRGEATASADPAAGGESITLGDVKVGSLVGGPGSLKGGVFVPKELQVSEPGARGQRRGGGEGASAAGAGPKQ